MREKGSGQTCSPPIFFLQEHFNNTRRLRSRIVSDQKRLHDNLAGLKDTSEERRLARRYAGETNADEHQLLTLLKQYAYIEQQRTAAQASLDIAIRGMNLDMDVSGA